MFCTRFLLACLLWLCSHGICIGAQGSASNLVSSTQAQESSAESGWLNLQTLLASPHKNAYLWGTLAFLGILSIGAGLSIQRRRTFQRLGMDTPHFESTEPSIPAFSPQGLQLPADIVALNLDLDLNLDLGSTMPSLNAPEQRPFRELQK
jgi:hypothetical protein